MEDFSFLQMSIPGEENNRRQGQQNWKPQKKIQGGWAQGERQVGKRGQAPLACGWWSEDNSPSSLLVNHCSTTPIPSSLFLVPSSITFFTRVIVTGFPSSSLLPLHYILLWTT